LPWALRRLPSITNRPLLAKPHAHQRLDALAQASSFSG
jgi:hypothetical protein